MIKVVGALIIQKRKILVAQRSHGELKGKWEFPGGKIEEGEDEKTAIVREIKEELGVDIFAKEIIKTFEHKYSFNEIKLTLIRCLLKDKKRTISLRGSHENIAWIDYNKTNIEFAPLDKKIFMYLIKNYVI